MQTSFFMRTTFDGKLATSAVNESAQFWRRVSMILGQITLGLELTASELPVSRLAPLGQKGESKQN